MIELRKIANSLSAPLLSTRPRGIRRAWLIQPWLISVFSPLGMEQIQDRCHQYLALSLLRRATLRNHTIADKELLCMLSCYG